TVEPVLGTLINFLGMRRINTRGIRNANKCMIMAAVAYNIKKLMKFNRPRPISKAMEVMQHPTQLNYYLVLSCEPHAENRIIKFRQKITHRAELSTMIST